MKPFEALIKEFAEQTGLPLQVDADDSCSLESDDMLITIQYRREQDDVIVFAPVVTPEDNEKLPYNVLQKALELSYNGQGTGNAFLGMFGGALVLSITLPLSELDAESLGVRVLAFTDTAQGIALDFENLLAEAGGFELKDDECPQGKLSADQELLFQL